MNRGDGLPAMLNYHVPTVACNGQTKHQLWCGPFAFFTNSAVTCKFGCVSGAKFIWFTHLTWPLDATKSYNPDPGKSSNVDAEGLTLVCGARRQHQEQRF